MSAPSSLPPPRALLLIAPGCPHCAALLQALSELVKEAIIARLEVVNLAADPDAGRAYGVRSVPWLRLGEFELTGALSKGQLRTGSSGSARAKAGWPTSRNAWPAATAMVSTP